MWLIFRVTFVMVRKVIISILAVLYISTSTGATINLHYCMGKLVDWSFEAKEKHSCSSCCMQKKDGCCKEETRQFKIASDQKPSSNFILETLEAQTVPAIPHIFPQVLNLSNSFYHQPSNNGPPLHAIAIYKYLRAFRI